MDEVADWRQRYDNESAKAEQHRQFLNQVVITDYYTLTA